MGGKQSTFVADGNSAGFRTFWFFSCSATNTSDTYTISPWHNKTGSWEPREDVVLDWVKEKKNQPCARAWDEETDDYVYWENQLGGMSMRADNVMERVKIEQRLPDDKLAVSECNITIADWPMDLAVSWYFGEGEDRGLFFWQDGPVDPVAGYDFINVACSGDPIT